MRLSDADVELLKQNRGGIYCIALKDEVWQAELDDDDAWPRVYIGQSGNAYGIKRRLQKHRRHLVAGKHKNKRLQEAWDRYGEEAFEAFVVTQIPDEVLSDNEDIWIRLFDAAGTYGYNIHKFARRVMRGNRATERSDYKNKIASMTQEQLMAYRKSRQATKRARLANMSPEQRSEYNAKRRASRRRSAARRSAQKQQERDAARALAERRRQQAAEKRAEWHEKRSELASMSQEARAERTRLLNKQSKSRRLDAMSPEERSAYKAAKAQREMTRKASMSAEDRAMLRKKSAESARKCYAAMTPEQRHAKNLKDYEAKKKGKKILTQDEIENRKKLRKEKIIKSWSGKQGEARRVAFKEKMIGRNHSEDTKIRISEKMKNRPRNYSHDSRMKANDAISRGHMRRALRYHSAGFD
jgi:hypothetical protein